MIRARLALHWREVAGVVFFACFTGWLVSMMADPQTCARRREWALACAKTGKPIPECLRDAALLYPGCEE